MIKPIWAAVSCLALSSACANEVLPLPHKAMPDIAWNASEIAYHSDRWNTPVVTNVAEPSLTVYTPAPGTANGTAVVIAPGGGFYALSIESEGSLVAEWLARRGVTAFVLKYRLVPTGEDGVAEIPDAADAFVKSVTPIIPLAVADGQAAVAYVRKNAERFGLKKDRIGVMGFSAGGTVALGAALDNTAGNRPDFVALVYPAVNVLGSYSVPDAAPPLFVVVASDDPLGLAPESVSLYSAWHNAGVSSALHVFAKGGHGWGMRTQGLPFDNWIERFHEWAKAQELVPE